MYCLKSYSQYSSRCLLLSPLHFSSKEAGGGKTSLPGTAAGDETLVLMMMMRVNRGSIVGGGSWLLNNDC